MFLSVLKTPFHKTGKNSHHHFVFALHDVFRQSVNFGTNFASPIDGEFGVAQKLLYKWEESKVLKCLRLISNYHKSEIIIETFCHQKLELIFFSKYPFLFTKRRTIFLNRIHVLRFLKKRNSASLTAFFYLLILLIEQEFIFLLFVYYRQFWKKTTQVFVIFQPSIFY